MFQYKLICQIFVGILTTDDLPDREKFKKEMKIIKKCNNVYRKVMYCINFKCSNCTKPLEIKCYNNTGDSVKDLQPYTDYTVEWNVNNSSTAKDTFHFRTPPASIRIKCIINLYYDLSIYRTALNGSICIFG